MKVGDYVRTKRGEVFKYVKYDEKDKQYRRTYKNDSVAITTAFKIEDVIKSSPNIIDLIEVGDYVNGKRVEWIGYDLYRENEDKTLTGIGEKRILFNEFTKDSVREKGINSIVTKEMFANAEYRVESN